jgi:hypothetical protein
MMASTMPLLAIHHKTECGDACDGTCLGSADTAAFGAET